MKRLVPVSLALLASLVGCSKKEDPASLAPAASALVASSASPTSGSWHYIIDPKSTAHVDMPGKDEHIKGDTTAASGMLDVAPHDLAQSRGLVKIDLSTFTTNTFGVADKDATQTTHARTWLEAVVDGKTIDDMRWAEYAIRSIDGVSAPDVTKVAATKGDTDDVRTVTMTVHGDLRIHGRKLAKDDVVDVLFHYPTGATADSKPTRVEVKSKQPFRVVLKDYEVAPRDPAGKALAWTTALVGKVAENADVTFNLGATVAP